MAPRRENQRRRLAPKNLSSGVPTVNDSMRKSTKTNAPARHHFLPEFFIKRFSENDERSVYVYNKRYDKLNPIPQSAGSICYQRHLYSIGPSNDPFFIIEESFSKFETKWAQTFEMLDGDMQSANALLLDRNGENIIRFFYACQFWRTPLRRELAMARADELLTLYDEMEPADLLVPIERRELKKIIKLKRSTDNIKIIQNFLFPMLTYRANSNNDARFRVIDKPLDYPSELICADVGVVGDTIEEVFGGADLRMFPLSRRRLLVLANGAAEITHRAIDEFQVALFKSATAYVFSATRAGLEIHCQRAKEACERVPQ